MRHFYLTLIFGNLYIIQPVFLDCVNDYVYLCEQNTIEIPHSVKPLRVPLTSDTCQSPGEAAVCEAVLVAKPGQKIFAKTGVAFEIASDTACSDGFVEFSSFIHKESESSVRKCNKIKPGVALYTSLSNNLSIKYNSSSANDGAVLILSAFGCPTDEFIYENAKLDFLQDFSYGKTYTARAYCEEGFLMADSRAENSVQCMANQTPASSEFLYRWNLTQSYDCIKMECPPLEEVVNGKILLTDAYNHKSRAEFTCDRGYELIGQNALECRVKEIQGASWEGTVPYCKIVDCGEPSIDNATLKAVTSTTYKSVINYHCDPGMIPIVYQAYCNEDGNWVYKQCEEIVCPLHEHGPEWELLTPAVSLTYPMKLSYKCIYDDEIVEVFCETLENGTGEWHPLLPTCLPPTTSANNVHDEVVCPDPAVHPSWVSLSEFKPSSFVPGVSIKFSCKYNDSQVEIICMETGDWNQLLKSCKEEIPHSPIERISKISEEPITGESGAIVGGVFGGLILLTTVFVAVCMFIKKWNKKRKYKQSTNNNVEELASLKHEKKNDDRPPKPQRLYHEKESNGTTPTKTQKDTETLEFRWSPKVLGSRRLITPPAKDEPTVEGTRRLVSLPKEDETNIELLKVKEKPNIDTSSDLGVAPLALTDNDLYESSIPKNGNNGMIIKNQFAK